MVGSGNCFPEPLIPQGLASGLQNPDATDLGELLGEFSFKMKHAPYFDKFLETLRTGRRKQDPLIPNEYRYSKRFDELLPENTHLVVLVLFKMRLDENGQVVPNNFVVTGWAKYIRPKR